MALDRLKFAAVAEELYSTIKYTETDCMGFVKLCAKKAGYSFSSSGTNYTWRNGLADKGVTSSYNLQVGDVVFRYYSPGDPYYDLPSKYNSSPDKRDVHHIGIITQVSGNKYTVCDSRGTIQNGQKETFNTKAALAKKWTLAGTLKNTAKLPTNTAVTPPTSTPQLIPTKPSTPVVMNGKYPKTPFKVTIKTNVLNYRDKPTTKGKSYGHIPKGTYTVTKVQNPKIINSWGKVTVNGIAAWINLNKSYVSW